jgi:hypothetical protein
MAKMLTHIGGSVFVLEISDVEYIDARKDVRTPDHVHLEHVINGHVVARDVATKVEALDIAKAWAK